YHHVGAGVVDVVPVQVGEEDRVDRHQADVALQRGERAGAEVQQQPETVGLHQVGRTGGLRAGKATGTTEHGEPHGAAPTELRSRSAPRNRWASRSNWVLSPVVSNRCTGGGASAGRARS